MRAPGPLMRWRQLLATVAIALAIATATADAQDTARRAVRPRTTYEDLQLFSQVLNQIRVNHPDSIDMHDALMAAIAAMVQAADPHSYVIPAIRLNAAKEAEWRSGKLFPVPVRFSFISGAPVVVGVSPGQSGFVEVRPGDELVSIDGAPVRAESDDELELTLAGPKGSKVVLGLERRRTDGTIARLTRTITRQRVGEESAVPVAIMLDSAVGYVRVVTFLGEKVADALHQAIVRLEQQGMQSLVLDLRDNGGGSVDEASAIAGEFLPQRSVIYTAAGRKAEVVDTSRVRRSFWRSERSYPMVVMINRGSASASELVAGALQDHDRALLVGQTSFGKSLLMRGFPMTDGSILMLVVGHVKTPCGRIVQRAYRNVSRRDYYRQAGAAIDTVGRPSCRSASGRTLYGGGGIVPDVPIATSPQEPLWLEKLRERSVALSWVGGYAAERSALLASLDSLAHTPRLPASDVDAFRRYADSLGVVIPNDSASSGQLERYLLQTVAWASWGARGHYRILVSLDPEIREAVRHIGRAAALRPSR